jgi:hypothetical protein
VKPVSLSPEAVAELIEAASWYETRQPGLAVKFLQDIDQAQQAIQSRPLSFPRLACSIVHMCSTAGERSRRMLKKFVQQGRSERGAEAYS